MIRPTDFTAAHVQRVTTVTPVWTTESRAANTWFDANNPAHIVGQVSLQARSLNVEEHTVRVLRHLIGERDLEV